LHPWQFDIDQNGVVGFHHVTTGLPAAGVGRSLATPRLVHECLKQATDFLLHFNKGPYACWLHCCPVLPPQEVSVDANAQRQDATPSPPHPTCLLPSALQGTNTHASVDHDGALPGG
jgi:hypothetical protein